MKASTKSIHAKLYAFTYTSDLPENLCPYFWKLIFSLLIFIPNFIIQIPALIIKLFVNNHGFEDSKDSRESGMTIYILFGLLSGYIHITSQWIKAMFNCYSYEQQCSNIGWVINAIIFIGLTTWGIVKLTKKRRSKGNINIKTPSIISEFIKAKYGKYCPKIDWE